MKVKAVIFDLDCTLHDRDTSLYWFLKSQYERLLASKLSISFYQYYNEFLQLEEFGRKWKDLVYEKLVTKYGVTGISSEELLEDYWNQFSNHCVAYEGTIPMLETLKKKGYLIGMITNGKTDFQKATINSLGIASFFDDIIISDEIGIKKPDKRIFEAALHNLGVALSDVVYIGDHPIDDIKAAINVGMKAVWKHNEKWGEAETSFVFKFMEDVPYIVDSLINV